MEQPKYKSSIISELFSICEEFPELTMGQILHTLRPKNLNGKNLFESSDEEIYIALEKARGEFSTEEPLEEKDFKNWVTQK